MPASIFYETLCANFILLVHILAAKPNLLSFANSIAYYSSLNLVKTKTGPLII